MTTMPNANTRESMLSIHGVFVAVFDTGVLITGPSGIGKSEVALGLLSRKHKLIADDCVYFNTTADGAIIGTCPPLLQDFIEVRGLGILNARQLFGDEALLSQKRCALIVHIEDAQKINPQAIDRLHGIRDTVDLLGHNLPKITLPVAPGRNLAILVEIAVRNQRLLDAGDCAATAFIKRQQMVLDNSTTDGAEKTR